MISNEKKVVIFHSFKRTAVITWMKRPNSTISIMLLKIDVTELSFIWNRVSEFWHGQYNLRIPRKQIELNNRIKLHCIKHIIFNNTLALFHDVRSIKIVPPWNSKFYYADMKTTETLRVLKFRTVLWKVRRIWGTYWLGGRFAFLNEIS